jgi:hypothetical protein
MGRLCYPTQHRYKAVPVGYKVVQVQGGYGSCFCRHGTRFDRSRACRSTILNEARKLSRHRIINEGTGAVSRYKVDRSQKIVTIYRIYIVCNGARPGAGFGRICLGSRVCKNRDKQLTHIVRVSISFVISYM